MRVAVFDIFFLNQITTVVDPFCEHVDTLIE